MKLAEAYGIRGAPREPARRRDPDRGAGARAPTGPVLIEFQVEKEDTVYPMVPAGSDLHDMIRRPAEEKQEVRA